MQACLYGGRQSCQHAGRHAQYAGRLAGKPVGRPAQAGTRSTRQILRVLFTTFRTDNGTIRALSQCTIYMGHRTTCTLLVMFVTPFHNSAVYTPACYTKWLQETTHLHYTKRLMSVAGKHKRKRGRIMRRAPALARDAVSGGARLCWY